MVRVIAHRGASAAAPENTIEAFRLAKELGADWVELDARRTADGQVIVHHDAELADGRRIVELDRAELPGSVCDLADALDACEGMSINIEIKNWPPTPTSTTTELVARYVVGLVQERSLHDRVLVSCFHYPTIELVHELDPADPHRVPAPADRPVLGRRSPPTSPPPATPPCTPGTGWSTRRSWRRPPPHGLEVNVWTVDDPDRMAELIALGVDGLCTNVPDIARQRRHRRPRLTVADRRPSGRCTRFGQVGRGSTGRTRSMMSGTWRSSMRSISPR